MPYKKPCADDDCLILSCHVLSHAGRRYSQPLDVASETTSASENRVAVKLLPSSVSVVSCCRPS